MLDLTRIEVQTYLFERLDTLLCEYPISYLKWDMNRAIHQPGDQYGRAVGHHQTRALYHLLERIRSAHPKVEIESLLTASGHRIAMMRLIDCAFKGASQCFFLQR